MATSDHITTALDEALGPIYQLPDGTIMYKRRNTRPDIKPLEMLLKCTETPSKSVFNLNINNRPCVVTVECYPAQPTSQHKGGVHYEKSEGRKLYLQVLSRQEATDLDRLLRSRRNSNQMRCPSEIGLPRMKLKYETSESLLPRRVENKLPVQVLPSDTYNKLRQVNGYNNTVTSNGFQRPTFIKQDDRVIVRSWSNLAKPAQLNSTPKFQLREGGKRQVPTLQMCHRMCPTASMASFQCLSVSARQSPKKPPLIDLTLSSPERNSSFSSNSSNAKRTLKQRKSAYSRITYEEPDMLPAPASFLNSTSLSNHVTEPRIIRPLSSHHCKPIKITTSSNKPTCGFSTLCSDDFLKPSGSYIGSVPNNSLNDRSPATTGNVVPQRMNNMTVWDEARSQKIPSTMIQPKTVMSQPIVSRRILMKSGQPSFSTESPLVRSASEPVLFSPSTSSNNPGDIFQSMQSTQHTNYQDINSNYNLNCDAPQPARPSVPAQDITALPEYIFVKEGSEYSLVLSSSQAKAQQASFPGIDFSNSLNSEGDNKLNTLLSMNPSTCQMQKCRARSNEVSTSEETVTGYTSAGPLHQRQSRSSVNVSSLDTPQHCFDYDRAQDKMHPYLHLTTPDFFSHENFFED